MSYWPSNLKHFYNLILACIFANALIIFFVDPPKSFPYYLFWLHPLVNKSHRWRTDIQSPKVHLFITLQILLSRFMDCFLVLGIMGQMNKKSIVETQVPFPFSFSLPDHLCSSMSFRSFLIWTSPVVSFSYFPFLIIHSPSYLMGCDHFPIMSLKKMNLILKVSLHH